jgi:hypothetical protein
MESLKGKWWRRKHFSSFHEMVTTQKTYFPIASTEFANTVDIPLPPYFCNSKSEQKYIVVRNCKAIVQDALVNDVKLHSDIVRECPYDDHFICFTNELMVKPKKYKWNNTSRTIRIWFTDMKNAPITVTEYLIDILLIY